MAAFILRRIAQALLVMLAVGLIAFSLFRFVGEVDEDTSLAFSMLRSPGEPPLPELEMGARYEITVRRVP